MDAFVKRTPKDDDASSNEAKPPVISYDEPARPAKRARRDEIPDSESESDDGFHHVAENGKVKVTDVENALPAADYEDALKEYEAINSSQTNERNDDGTTIQTRPMWMKGRSSIYVDAFNLALDTVLDEESHLFDDKEREVFNQWKELDYEAQFM